MWQHSQVVKGSLVKTAAVLKTDGELTIREQRKSLITDMNIKK